MSKSYAFEDDGPVSGKSVACDDALYGTLAENVPTTGEHGGGYAAEQASALPAGTVVRAPITTPISPTPTFFKINTDTSFELVAPDGTYKWQYDIYADGVRDLNGPFEQTVIIGAAPPVSAQLVMLV